MRVLKRVTLVCQEVENNAYWHLKTMENCVDQTCHGWVVVESIVVKLVEFRGISLQNGPLKGCGNICFDKGRPLKDYQALKTLDKEYYVSVINIFTHRHYLTFSVCPIKVGVKVT